MRYSIRLDPPAIVLISLDQAVLGSLGLWLNSVVPELPSLEQMLLDLRLLPIQTRDCSQTCSFSSRPLKARKFITRAFSLQRLRSRVRRVGSYSWRLHAHIRASSMVLVAPAQPLRSSTPRDTPLPYHWYTKRTIAPCTSSTSSYHWHSSCGSLLSSCVEWLLTSSRAFPRLVSIPLRLKSFTISSPPRDPLLARPLKESQ